ncbi:MAG: AAA family ATPase [Oscillospiraceae bacterium]|nr:AAA family ATPase [Oscillospiraceae bacterium]
MGNNVTGMIDLSQAANWQVNTSESAYLLVRRLLRSFAEDLQNALVREEKHYRSRLEKEKSSCDAMVEQQKKRHLTIPNQQAEREFSNLCAACRGKRDNVRSETEEELKSLSIMFRRNTPLEKIVTFFISRQDADTISGFDARRNHLDSLGRSMDQALDAVILKGRKLRDAKVMQNNRVFGEYRDAITKASQLELENIENEHRNTVAMLVNAYAKEFNRYFNTAAFATAYDMVGTKMRSATGYSCSDKIPDALYFGVRTFTITNGTESFAPEVLNLFRRIEHPAVSIQGSTISVSLPFFRTIEEGYSVYLEVNDAFAPAGNKILWDYVMKVLMNFPAGQTRPLLLDCDSTPELTDFRAIGESSGRNMITKAWTDAEEIEAELKKLSDDHSNLTTSYGKDIASRMLREPIYVVACRNFPKDISEQAMDSMTSIISAGSARGFFGILQVSPQELANRRGVPGFSTQLGTIRKFSLCVKETGNGFVIVDDTGTDKLEFERMRQAEANKKEIFSYLIDGVARYRRQVEKFEYLFSKDAGNISGMDMHNINTWYRGDASSRFEVPIGISGASTVQKYIIDGVAQHGLISGVTGSGKSTLLKTIIIAAMMKYTPDNLNLYLVDFKEGVEFATFSEYPLPWIKAIALNTQRIFALNMLRQLQKEFEHRANIMRQDSVHHIKSAGQKFPRILLIFDEVQELLRIDDDITRECINILSSLVSEGRAMSINVIMASQNFAVCRGVDALKANMVIRIALKGSPESARIVMGENFSVDQLEQGDSGSAAINTASGTRGKTTFFQVGFLEDAEMKDLLSKLAMTMSTRKASTRIMAVHANQDRGSKFNRLIADGEVDYAEKPGNYELMLGDEFIIDRKREISIGDKDGENLMLVGSSEPTAKSIFALSILSVLYGELASRAKIIDNELVRLIDMSDEYAADAEYLHYLSSRFSRQVNRVTGEDARSMIDDTYRVLQERKRGQADKSERLFLMIFGMDSIQCLQQEMFGEEDGELSQNRKLLRLIQEGPKLGINCILWARSYDGFKEIVDTVSMNRYFNKRIYFGENEDAQKVLGIRYDMSTITEKTVAFRDMSKAVPNTFRVFELPNPRWVESIAESYERFRQEQ